MGIRKLLFFLCFIHVALAGAQQVMDEYGALVRSDTLQKKIYLCFTGHDYDEGFDHVLKVLKKQGIQASFFVTGDFIRSHKKWIKKWSKNGHFIGAHSNKHLLYNDWNKRDSLLHTLNEIKMDIGDNLLELKKLGIAPTYFMPPYEWYNAEVVRLVESMGQITVNFSYGTRSNADYTTADMKNYRSSDRILEGIYKYERDLGLNGFHLLIHPGTSPKRMDKLYLHLETLIVFFKKKGYGFERF